MACPVSRCNGIMFHTKNKFIQDWEERHRIQARKFLCPVAGCLAESRRKSDRKAYLRTKHEKDPQRLEAILLKCQSVGREKKGYIDPGLFIFKSDSVIEATKTVQEIVETVLNDKDQTGTDQVKTLSDKNQTSIKRQSILLEEYRDRSTVKRNSSATIGNPHLLEGIPQRVTPCPARRKRRT